MRVCRVLSLDHERDFGLARGDQNVDVVSNVINNPRIHIVLSQRLLSERPREDFWAGWANVLERSFFPIIVAFKNRMRGL